MKSLFKLLSDCKKIESVDLLLFASVGGHLDQLLDLSDVFLEHNYVIVVNDTPPDRPILKKRTLQITHCERGVKQLANVIECLFLTLRFRPKVVLSTGSSPAVWFSLFAKSIGSKVIFIESMARVESLSLTGRIVKLLADDFFVQWPLLAKKTKAKYVGLVGQTEK